MGDPRTLEHALARSAVYSALALAFGPPGTEVAVRLASADGAAALQEAFLALEAPTLAGTAAALAGLAVSADRYQSLFGHTARGEAPPYETEYGADALFSQPRELSDIGGFLAAFGLQLDHASHERVDHIRCECEFMGFLARKEAFALEQDDAAMVAATRKGERLFLRDHLGRFASAFGERLWRADSAGFYGALGKLLRAFSEHECQRLGLAPGDRTLALRPLAEEDTAPVTCGGAGCDAGGCP